MSALAMVGLGLQVIGGISKIVGGNKKAKEALAKEEAAQKELDALKAQFQNIDTSNPYLGLQNMYEDMTVNQQEAEFKRQTNVQNQADILQKLRSSAGTSGIAALAQTLANQGSIDAQKAAVSIGTQEQAIQEKVMSEASKIQTLEREGEVMSRQAEMSKMGSLMGLAASDVAAARQDVATAQGQVAGGVGDITGGWMNVADFAMGGNNYGVEEQQVT
jgi:hypothetical protein|tara:strand:+ start:6997 stop:7650 length:654 start_codon:yes stop_codon:yes gene_type:complete